MSNRTHSWGTFWQNEFRLVWYDIIKNTKYNSVRKDAKLDKIEALRNKVCYIQENLCKFVNKNICQRVYIWTSARQRNRRYRSSGSNPDLASVLWHINRQISTLVWIK